MRALVLSGGGSKGAAEVGVLDYLLEQNPDLDYDIYAGVSVGALNGAILAEAPLKESYPKLKDIWLNQVKGSSSVWSHHLWYYILACIILILLLSFSSLIALLVSAPKFVTIGLFLLSLGSFYFPYRTLNESHSVYVNDPLRKLVSSNLSIEKLMNSGKRIAVGTVSFNSGNYRSIQHIDEKIIDWIMASSAFPVFFPMSYIDGEYWTDGGVANTAPIADVIEMGATEIDVIITSPISAGQFYGPAALVKQVMRNIDIMSSKILQDEIITKDLAKLGIKIRFFIVDHQLTSNSLDFTPSKLQNMFQEGRKLAEKVSSS
jgi:NTE family protein